MEQKIHYFNSGLKKFFFAMNKHSRSLYTHTASGVPKAYVWAMFVHSESFFPIP